MMIGCDLSKIDAFTYNLLANHKVNAINQDALGSPARVIYHEDDIMVWAKLLETGERAIGIFNLQNEDRDLTLPWSTCGIEEPQYIFDAWRHLYVDKDQDFRSRIVAHGVELLVLR
ncbi:MAG: alpha-galactosidase, partial [Bacteroidota bacterium]